MNNDATSIRLNDGNIGCSRCKLPLIEIHSPFYIRKEYVGHFDSIDCPICHFHIFTEKGYGNAMQMACKYGLVGPPEEEEEVEMCNTSQSQDIPVESSTSRVTKEQFLIMTVQGQISLLQFIQSDNRHKINYNQDESIDILQGSLNDLNDSVQSSLKAMRNFTLVDVT